MSNEQAKALGKTLWAIANTLRGSMDADQFRDYMLGFIFFKFLSDKYEIFCETLLTDADGSLKDIYSDPVKNAETIHAIEEECKKGVGYSLAPQHLWGNFVEFSKNKKNPYDTDKNIMEELRDTFKHIEESTIGLTSAEDIDGLFGEIEFNSQRLGASAKEKSEMLYNIISELDSGLGKHNLDEDELGDAYEYLIGEFASNSGKKAGEFYTPQRVSTILAKIVSLDPSDPSSGKTRHIKRLYDPTCGSASLLFNVYHETNKNVGEIYGQEKNITTYNLARMNLLLHHIPYQNFHVFQGDTLTGNQLEKIENNKIRFDAIVANPPFSLKWDPSNMESDDRFRGYGLPPQSTADFAFILHMLYYLAETGTLAVVVPHGVLFRSGSEGQIRESIIKKGYLDAVIGLPSNLFYSTGIPVCVLVFKKCDRFKDVLFIDASKEFEKEKRQNVLTEEHIEKIVNTYQQRAEVDKYATRVTYEQIAENNYNLNIPRYVDTSKEEMILDPQVIVNAYKELKTQELTIDAKIKIMCAEFGAPCWD